MATSVSTGPDSSKTCDGYNVNNNNSEVTEITVGHPQPQGTNTVKKDIIKPSSYLIFDNETTGLPGPYGNPRITELCLLGVHREDLFEDGVKIPRIINKLQLCLNPQKRVTPGSSMITGLFNDTLERQQPFNHEIIALIRGFIQIQAQPTCLIAHNGHKFDFPLLASELMMMEEELPQNLLCADSLLAFRELDADPEGQSSESGLKGQQTWNQTEVTPLKRGAKDHTQDESVVPKKPRKDFQSESLFKNIARERVVKKLQFKDSTSENKNVEFNETTDMSGIKFSSGPQTDSDSNLKRLNDLSARTDSGDCVEEDTEAAPYTSNHTDIQQALTVQCDNQTESRKHEQISPCSQGSLLDGEFLTAVTQIESENNVISHNQKKEKVMCSNPFPITSNSLDTNDLCSVKSRVQTSASLNVNSTPLTVTSAPFTIASEALAATPESMNLSTGSQAKAGVPQASFTSTAEVSTLNLSNEEVAVYDDMAVPNISADTTGRPVLFSEETVIYNYGPTKKTEQTGAAEKTEQTGSTVLNSQGSLADDDFLAAVQIMEIEQQSKTVEQSNSVAFDGLTEVKVMGTGVKNNNSSSTKGISERESEKSNVRNIHEVTGLTCLSEESEKSPQNMRTPNGSKRRSFRLADIYIRQFGHPPQIAHTAEDDCISLLKVVKKFSPRILDWIDENCVPFRTVKPLY